MSDIITNYKLKERQRLAKLAINVIHDIEKELETLLPESINPFWIMPHQSYIDKLNAVLKELRETL